LSYYPGKTERHGTRGEEALMSWSAARIASPLSDRDRDLFLSLLDNPPEPNEALKNAMRKHGRRGESAAGG
jgi:hypothetical protein